ncbi:MAG: methionyl-tRNA formyltransferase [Candidatus Magasanikbacteria bacterium]
MSNQQIKTFFFGTHDFAVTILQGLIDSPLIEVVLVITRPDKPVGRKKKLQKSPVKIFAEQHNLPIDQPASLKTHELDADDYQLGITAQYGALIPKHILETPKYGILNVHTSLLPKYRGASPIQSALMNGETETGVTIMKMDVGLDTGSILLQKSIEIAPDDTYLDLDRKLAEIGSETLLEAIPTYTSGKLEPADQDDSKATTCKQLSREDGKIDWNQSAQKIYNQYRGMTPWPGVWTMWNDRRLKLLKIKPAEKQIEAGKVLIEDGTMYIGCSHDSIEVLELQLEGKKVMDVKTFVKGYHHVDKNILI